MCKKPEFFPHIEFSHSHLPYSQGHKPCCTYISIILAHWSISLPHTVTVSCKHFCWGRLETQRPGCKMKTEQNASTFLPELPLCFIIYSKTKEPLALSFLVTQFKESHFSPLHPCLLGCSEMNKALSQVVMKKTEKDWGTEKIQREDSFFRLKKEEKKVKQGFFSCS